MIDIYMLADPDKEGFSWIDPGLDDFITDPRKATKCHVPMEYLTAYAAKYATGKQSTDINVTFVGFCNCGDNAICDFDWNTGKLTISGTGAMWDFKAESIGGSGRTTAPWKEYIDDIKTVEIGKDITGIGSFAFYKSAGGSGIRRITFEHGIKLTSIGRWAFNTCQWLKSIDIPAGVTTIGDCAFENCIRLETVIFENNSKLETIGRMAFDNCCALKAITLPSTVTTIIFDAFYR